MKLKRQMSTKQKKKRQVILIRDDKRDDKLLSNYNKIIHRKILKIVYLV